MYNPKNLYSAVKRDGFTQLRQGSRAIQPIEGAEHFDRALLWCRQQNFAVHGVNAVGPALLDSRGVKIGYVGGSLFWEYCRLKEMPTLRDFQSSARKVLTHDNIAIVLDRMYVGDYGLDTRGEVVSTRLVWIYDQHDSCVSIYIAVGEKDDWEKARQTILRKEIEQMATRLPWMKVKSV